MKDLQALYETALNIVKDCRIDYGDIVEITINTRAKKRWGQCRKRDGRFYININERILEDDTDPHAVLETIIHEILHTVDGCFNHGKEWKNYAERVYQTTGFKITRTTSAERFGIALEENRKSRYVFVCEKCGAVVRRDRMSKFVRHPERYHCGRCGGKFKQDLSRSTHEVWRAV